MPVETASESRYWAVRHFRNARSRAAREGLVARLTRKRVALTCYEDVRGKLTTRTGRDLGLLNIPLDSVAGSVGRCGEFSRSFLPLRDSDQDRWVRVYLAATRLSGLPPIEAYKVGDIYFVVDGNHRVSVARARGATHIEARVMEISTTPPRSAEGRDQDAHGAVEDAG